MCKIGMFERYIDSVKFEPYIFYKAQILDCVFSAGICITACFLVRRGSWLNSDHFVATVLLEK